MMFVYYILCFDFSFSFCYTLHKSLFCRTQYVFILIFSFFSFFYFLFCFFLFCTYFGICLGLATFFLCIWCILGWPLKQMCKLKIDIIYHISELTTCRVVWSPHLSVGMVQKNKKKYSRLLYAIIYHISRLTTCQVV